MISSIINSVSEHANNCDNFLIHWYSLSWGSISQTLSSFLIQSLEWYVLFHGFSYSIPFHLISNVCCILFQSSLKQGEFSYNLLGCEYGCMWLFDMVFHSFLIWCWFFYLNPHTGCATKMSLHHTPVCNRANGIISEKLHYGMGLHIYPTHFKNTPYLSFWKQNFIFHQLFVNNKRVFIDLWNAVSHAFIFTYNQKMESGH